MIDGKIRDIRKLELLGFQSLEVLPFDSYTGGKQLSKRPSLDRYILTLHVSKYVKFGCEYEIKFAQ